MSSASAEVIRTDAETRILVVDDEPEIAALVAESLRQSDPSWLITEETDPRRALQRLGEEEFDCLVTDLAMPVMNGLVLAEKARELNEDIALIAITGHGNFDTSVEAMRLGFSDFIPKPFDLDALTHAVCRSICERRARRAMNQHNAELTQQNARLEVEQSQLNQKLQIASQDLVFSSKRMARQMEDVASQSGVARSLIGIIELEDLLGLCAELVGDRVTCQSSTIALYEGHESAVGLMVRAYPESEDPPALCWLRTPLRSGLMCRAAQTRKSVHVDNMADSVLAHPDEKDLWRDGRVLVVPIPHQDHSIGAAVLHRPADAPDFSPQDVKQIVELAKVMGPAIMTAKIHHQQRCRIYATLEAVAEAVEQRDSYLKGHAFRVLGYAQLAGPALELSQSQIGALQIAARLHDLGRIIIPESAVNHAGALSDEQWEVVRQHPEAGERFLKPLDFFGEVAEIIRTHHESFDGTGYPDMRAGDEIPRVSRLIAVADAFDAMTSLRPYRLALSIDEALEQLQKLAGQQFDPQVVEAFMGIPRDALEQIHATGR